MKNFLVEISARHIHLCSEDKDKLFGPDFKLTKLKSLSQPSLFACEETVDLKVGEKKIKNVRIIGPLRPYTQIEISKTDARFLKAPVPLRISGDIDHSQGCTLIGPAGVVNLGQGMIIAKRHLHLPEKEAKTLNLKQGQVISIRIAGKRGLIFKQVIVRVDQKFRAAVHIDTDEGNAAGIEDETKGKIII